MFKSWSKHLLVQSRITHLLAQRDLSVMRVQSTTLSAQLVQKDPNSFTKRLLALRDNLSALNTLKTSLALRDNLSAPNTLNTSLNLRDNLSAPNTLNTSLNLRDNLSDLFVKSAPCVLNTRTSAPSMSSLNPSTDTPQIDLKVTTALLVPSMLATSQRNPSTVTPQIDLMVITALLVPRLPATSQRSPSMVTPQIDLKVTTALLVPRLPATSQRSPSMVTPQKDLKVTTALLVPSMIATVPRSPSMVTPKIDLNVTTALLVPSMLATVPRTALTQLGISSVSRTDLSVQFASPTTMSALAERPAPIERPALSASVVLLKPLAATACPMCTMVPVVPFTHSASTEVIEI